MHLKLFRTSYIEEGNEEVLDFVRKKAEKRENELKNLEGIPWTAGMLILEFGRIVHKKLFSRQNLFVMN